MQAFEQVPLREVEAKSDLKEAAAAGKFFLEGFPGCGWLM